MNIKYNGQDYVFEDFRPIIDAMGDIIKDEERTGKEIIACRYNNEVKSLRHPINKNGEIEFIDITDADGRAIYIRGLLFLMGKAFAEVYPDAKLSVNYQLSNAMYCEVDNMKVTHEMIGAVKAKMLEYVAKDIPITKVSMSKEEAAEFYAKEETLRGKLQMDAKYKDVVSLYYCEEYYNYFYGSMPLSTGFAKRFDVNKYHAGFLVRYPSKSYPYAMGNYKASLKLLSALEEYDNIYKLLKIDTVYRLNRKIRENKAKDCIILAEALHEKKIAEIANKISERKNIRMVLIAGPSSSGKTTFAGKLGTQLRLNGFKPVTISVDNYFVEREDTPRDEKGNYDFECIEALDLDLFNDHLVKLLNGEEIEVPTFDFQTGHKKYLGNKMRLEDDEILVIEGIHCMNDRLTSAIPSENKFKVYISDLTVLNVDYYNRISTTDTRLIRRIVRDYKYRGYSALQTLKTWYSVNRGEQKYIFPFQDKADCMFNSSLIYELNVLKKYVVPLLKEIPNTEREYSEARRLTAMLDYFEDIEDRYVPNNSLLREFIGGSIYHDDHDKEMN